MKFRKKPVVIEAIRLNKISNEKVVEFLGGESHRNIDFTINNSIGVVNIVTMEGTMTANPGDWIIRGIKGEFYPCKPDIFEATYESVDNAAPEALNNYAAVKQERDEAVGLLTDPRLDLAGLVTHRFPLEQYQRAFELAAKGREEAIKVAFVFP